MSAVNGESSPVPEQLVEQLAKGYDALASEVKRMYEHERQLENKLSWAKQQYRDVLKRFNPQSSSKDYVEFLSELEEAGACEKEGGDADWLTSLSKSQNEESRTRAYAIQRATDAREKIDYRRMSVDFVNGVKIWAGKSADPTDPSTMEYDFTTSGNPGRLGCPFSAGKAVNGVNGNRGGISTPKSSVSRLSFSRRSKRASFHDPIRAEVCGNRHVPSEPSVEGSMPLCPIRFMDQHSPEEVATYFEKHKHELPKSHEFCVKRFQENEEIIKDLDSKYANIVSMVKGLGKVHQPMLPNQDEIVIDDEDETAEVAASTTKVEKWAQAVSADGVCEAEDAVVSEDDDRESRFGRPLKDIRVGESPSRPWGIHVPAEFQDGAGEDRSKRSDHTASPLELPSPKGAPQRAASPLKCPFSGALRGGQGAPAMPADHPPVASASPIVPPSPSLPPQPTPPHIADLPEPKFDNLTAQPQMVFNGPVFFGYSFDQAMALMKQAGVQR